MIVKRERFQKVAYILRIALGLSVEEMAELLDVSRATVIYNENGHHQMTGIYYLAAYYTMLNKAKEIDNVYALSMIKLLVDEDIRMPFELRQEVIDICKEAARSCPKRAGIKGMQKCVLDVWHSWLTKSIKAEST